LETKTNELFNLFVKEHGDIDPSYFNGVTTKFIHILEAVANVNITIYSIEKSPDEKLIGELVRRSIGLYPENVNLVQYQKHVSYVADPNELFALFRCKICSRFFKRSGNLKRHISSCTEKTTNVYPGGVYNPNDTIFKKLHELKIYVPKELQLFNNFAVYDFESYCEKDSESNESEIENREESALFQNTKKLVYLGQHVPISVSVCDNMQNEVKFICNKDPTQLVTEFCQHLATLSEKSRQIVQASHKKYLDQLETLFVAV
jgi:hypothetical protein